MNRGSLFVSVLAVGLLVGMSAHAGTLNYTLDASEEVANLGSTADVSFTLDNIGLGLTGWGWGVCQSAGGAVANVLAVVDGADTGALNDGDGPEFNAVNILPNGWTIGAIVELVGNGTLAAGLGLEMNVGTYMGNVEGTETLSYCSTLGSPPVLLTLTLDGGGVADEFSGDLGLMDGSVTVVPGPAPFAYTLNDASGLYDSVSGAGADVGTTQSITATQDGSQLATQGFSVGFTQDGPCMLTAADPTGVLAAINDGDGPEFFGSNLDPAGGPGFTVGVVYALLGGSDINYTADSSEDVIAYNYALDAGALAGTMSAECNLTLNDVTGDPPVTNTVVAGPESPTPDFNNGVITLTGVTDTPHIRGDCNDDGTVNIADGIHTISAFVAGTQEPLGNCLAACDANGDEIGPDVSDAVYIFNYRFMDGPEPPAPFPGCGTRAGVGVGSGCDAYNSCP